MEVANCGIYQIVNIANNRRYIGSAVNLAGRYREHKSDLNRGVHCNVHLQHSYNKYGKDSFIFELISTCHKEDLLKMEQFYINSYDFDELYNIAKIAGSNLGYKYTDQQKLNLIKSIEKRRGDLKWINKKGSRYIVNIYINRVKYYLRTCETLDEAKELRDLVFEKLEYVSDLSVIQTEVLKHRAVKKTTTKVDKLKTCNKKITTKVDKLNTGIYYYNNRYRTTTWFNKKTITLGTFDTIEEAINIKKCCDDKLRKGESIKEIIFDNKPKRKVDLPNGINLAPSGRYQASVRIIKTCYIGTYDTVEEAVMARKEFINLKKQCA